MHISSTTGENSFPQQLRKRKIRYRQWMLDDMKLNVYLYDYKL